MPMKYLKQTGDTIVEVLIAMTVLSAVLGSAYVLANLSLQRVRQSQEHSEALKLAQAQIEQVKQLADGGGKDVGTDNVFTSTDFCITVTTGLDIKASTDTACEVTNGIKYNRAIYRTHDATTNVHTYRAIVSWDSINRNDKDNVTLIYNLGSN
jgi:type II secretory pathway pseudopilin PulG